MEPKERILVKSDELFNRYGIRSVSMDDIAAALGMSKKTLYQYYTDKDELVHAVFTKIIEDNRTHCCLDKQVADNAIHEVFLAFERVQDMFTNMHLSVLFDLQKYHPVTFKTFEDYKNGFLYQLIRTNIERGIAEGLYRPEIDVDIITRFRIYSIMLSLNPDVFPSNRSSLLYIEQQLLEHFLNGMATPKGKELIEQYKNQLLKITVK